MFLEIFSAFFEISSTKVGRYDPGNLYYAVRDTGFEILIGQSESLWGFYLEMNVPSFSCF